MKFQAAQKITLIALLSTLSVASFAQSKKTTTTKSNTQINKRVDVEKDLDTLGGNEALMEKAQAIDPENRSRIVQKRTVDRNMRLELGVSYGGVANGDSYLKTQSLGAAADFHFTPRWSLGVRYNDYGNDLTAEGKRVMGDARAKYAAGGSTYVIPDIDYPLQSAVAMVSFYPIYGKTNLFDRSIAQFDIYMTGGGGQIQLSSGWTSLLTAGAGVGVWMGQHLTLRTELRYQTYRDQLITGARTINGIIGTAGVGFLL